jgi:hypothetical protein
VVLILFHRSLARDEKPNPVFAHVLLAGDVVRAAR